MRENHRNRARHVPANESIAEFNATGAGEDTIGRSSAFLTAS
jgi:hypothetical protein